MPFIRYKKFGEQVYAYEVTAHYDKELKKPWQKVKYLGKVTDQGIKRVRVISTPRSAFEYGDVATLVRIGKETGLFLTLKQCYGDELANTILALAINKNLRGIALRNFKTWYEGTYLTKLTPTENASSQNLSRLLANIGTDERSLLQFFQAWQKRNGAKSTVTYDITSLSSSSKLIELLEYGYNRDHDDLPQVNFGLVTSMDTELPLYFKIFPGSITDVTTLKNLLLEIQSLGIEKTLFILDRGFYSKANILELILEHMNFVIPLPFHLKEAQRIISHSNSKITSPSRAVSFKGEVIYVTTGELTIEMERVSYYLYFDEQRRAREINTFYTRLIELEKKLNGRPIQKWEYPDEIVREATGKFASYFSWKKVEGKLALKRKSKAISRAINRMGKTILLYRGELDWESTLSYYRGKDTIEKMFESVKHDLAGLPLRVHKETTLKGTLLITFTSIILHFSLLKRMRENKLLEDYSVEGLLLELSKIKKIELLDGTEYTSEVSKKARTIFQKLNLEDIVPKT